PSRVSATPARSPGAGRGTDGTTSKGPDDPRRRQPAPAWTGTSDRPPRRRVPLPRRGVRLPAPAPGRVGAGLPGFRPPGGTHHRRPGAARGRGRRVLGARRVPPVVAAPAPLGSLRRADAAQVG